MKIETISIDKIIANLDFNSRQNFREAQCRIKNVLGVEDSWLEFMEKVNFWEWATKFYWDSNKMDVKEFAALYFLISKIRETNVILKPISLERNYKDNKWFLRNGCHRLSIACEFGINEIPVEWYEVKN